MVTVRPLNEDRPILNALPQSGSAHRVESLSFCHGLPAHFCITMSKANAAIVYKTGSNKGVGVIGSNKVTKKDEEEMERSLCFICATEHPSHWALYECGHRVCQLCALRMRILYENNQCSLCKVPSPRVLFIKSHADAGAIEHTGSFEDLWSPKCHSDPRHQDLFFADADSHAEVMGLIKVRCPVAKCREGGMRQFHTIGELKQHVSVAHSAEFCDVCLKHKKVFCFEQQLYKRNELARHQNDLDGKGNRAHPACSLCNMLFYSEDELNEHCRDKHEQCHICRRQLFASTAGSSANTIAAAQVLAQQREAANKATRNTFYRDYGELESHFKKDHYLCTDPVCLELKFIVFETEFEYKAHISEVHMSGMKLQRAAQNQIRRIETSFALPDRPSSASSNHGGRGGNRPGRDHRGQRDEISSHPSEGHRSSPPQSSNVLPPVPQLKVCPERLVYGEAIGGLASKLQSLSLYEQRNEEFLDRLRNDFLLSPKQISSLRTCCNQFQKGSLTSMALVLKLDALLGSERLATIAPSLVELQLDSLKRIQLDNDVSAHLAKLAAFPALPPPTRAEGAASSSKSKFVKGSTSKSDSIISKTLQSVQGGQPSNPVVLRIKPVTQVKPVLPTGVDPSRNPLALIGSIQRPTASSSSSSPKMTTAKPSNQLPSFRQAIGTTSSAAILDEVPQEGTGRPLDEADYPTLPGQKAPASAPAAGTVGNIFASGPNRNELESFIIGDTEQAATFEVLKDSLLTSASVSESSSTPATTAKSGKKKQKGQVILKYG